MKMKSLAMLGLAGIVALSLCHSAMAQDTGSTNPSASALPPTPMGSSTAVPSAGDASPNTGSANNMDQGGPDTATGDDDY